MTLRPLNRSRGGSGHPGAGAGVAALEGAALVLGEAAPDAGVLTGLQRPREAGLDDLAATADRLGLLDLDQRRAGVPDREEQLGSSSRQADRWRQSMRFSSGVGLVNAFTKQPAAQGRRPAVTGRTPAPEHQAAATERLGRPGCSTRPSTVANVGPSGKRFGRTIPVRFVAFVTVCGDHRPSDTGHSPRVCPRSGLPRQEPSVTDRRAARQGAP